VVVPGRSKVTKTLTNTAQPDFNFHSTYKQIGNGSITYIMDGSHKVEP
jgi:hypothetical protein